jgi:nitrogenase subunit NifH
MTGPDSGSVVLAMSHGGLGKNTTSRGRSALLWRERSRLLRVGLRPSRFVLTTTVTTTTTTNATRSQPPDTISPRSRSIGRGPLSATDQEVGGSNTSGCAQFKGPLRSLGF